MARDLDRTRLARRESKRLSKRDADRVRQALERLADSALGDIKRLRGGHPPMHRLRVGSWRVIIELEEDVIRIKRVLHRREAYRESSWARLALPRDGDLFESEGVEASGDVGT